MIAEGRIAVDGKVLETAATVLTSLRGVTVDGQPVKDATPARLFRFHKPAGTLTAERDPKGRPTIYDRLPKGLPRLIPVGRLDYNTEGLLLLTTDGELKRQLELPSTGVERAYRARAFGEISQEQLEELIHGIEIDGMRYGAIDANLERRTGRNQWIEMKLKEGKNREVRRVLEHLGLEVSRLIRTAYGPFGLGDLPVGAVDEIRAHDLVVFRASLKGGTPLPPPPAGEGGPRLAQPGGRARARPAPRPAAARTERRPSDDKPRPERPARSRPPGERPSRPERPARPSQRPNAGRPPAKPARPGRPPRGAEAAAQAPEPAAKPKHLKRGEGWAKPKGPGGKRPSSRSTPRGGGGGGKGGPTRGRPSGGKR
ncbi:MAG: hypothetical protein JWL74_765 [Alphaproteobacteria bacterium]|nr:hypothetical protein [Alphaproteobacteria bacterium]